MKLYVNNNGELLENDGPTIEAGNRGYLYGDGLFESIRVINGEPINLNVHILRMLEGMAVLKMRIPAFFTKDFFYKQIKEVLAQSQITEGAKVRLSIDRMSGGTYRPISNEVTYFIEAYPLENNFFKLNTKGIEVDLYQTIKKEKNCLSGFKTKNSLPFVMASIEAIEKKLDDILLTDKKGAVVESTSSNIFLVSNGILYTPGLEEGCVGGTMRMTIINLALENNMRVYESPMMPQSLFYADEMFLTNAINGITWIGGFRTKRYVNNTSNRFIEMLNNQFSSIGSAVESK